MNRLAAIAFLALAPLAACVVPQGQPASSYNQAGSHQPDTHADGQVYINGQVVAPRDAASAQIPAGRYWYDARSGLWGHEGGPTMGITGAGIAVAEMQADASGGNTGVYVNGRNLPAQDVAALQNLLRIQVQPGRYFLDADGSMGYEGRAAEVNLLQVARAQQASSGGSGDNFWSRGIINAAGNESNGAGYVCVDGNCSTYGM